MKKILLIIPIIICLILSVCVPTVSFADSSYTFEGDSTDGIDPAGLTYCPLDYFQTENNFQNGDYYFYATFARGSGVSIGYSGYVQVDEIESVEESNGIYTIILPDFTFLHFYTLGLSDNFQNDSIKSSSVKKIVVNTNSPYTSVEFFERLNSTSTNFPPFGGYLYHYDTNMFDDSVNSLPKVIVEFDPVLKGNVDRTVVNSNGTKSLVQELQMTVHNFSNFPIQYSMKIFKSNQVTHRNSIPNDSDGNVDDFSDDLKDWVYTVFDDDPVFVYYSNTQVYSREITAERPVLNSSPELLYNKASEWHRVEAGGVDTVNFPFSMINLQENVEYYVVVDCYRLNYDYVCDVFTTQTNRDHYVSDRTFVTSYYEKFRFLTYSDIKYNPNQTSGNVLPFDTSGGVSQWYGYKYNYDAVTDPSTNKTSIGHFDLFKDPNSWVNNPKYVFDDLNKIPSLSDSAFNSDITSFSGMFANVFGFVSMFLDYLPSQIMSIFIFGFSCIVVIAIIKAVR